MKQEGRGFEVFGSGQQVQSRRNSITKFCGDLFSRILPFSAQLFSPAMAAALKQIQTRATSIGKLVQTHGSTYYKQLMEQNKHYVVEPPTIDTVHELQKKYVFTQLASLPGRYQSALKEVEMLKSKWANRTELPLSEVGLGAVFAAEVYAWFCVGEIIGRGGTFTGYKV